MCKMISEYIFGFIYGKQDVCCFFSPHSSFTLWVSGRSSLGRVLLQPLWSLLNLNGPFLWMVLLHFSAWSDIFISWSCLLCCHINVMKLRILLSCDNLITHLSFWKLVGYSLAGNIFKCRLLPQLLWKKEDFQLEM